MVSNPYIVAVNLDVSAIRKILKKTVYNDWRWSAFWGHVNGKWVYEFDLKEDAFLIWIIYGSD